MKLGNVLFLLINLLSTSAKNLIVEAFGHGAAPKHVTLSYFHKGRCVDDRFDLSLILLFAKFSAEECPTAQQPTQPSYPNSRSYIRKTRSRPTSSRRPLPTVACPASCVARPTDAGLSAGHAAGCCTRSCRRAIRRCTGLGILCEHHWVKHYQEKANIDLATGADIT